jgi:hypothetical protein
MAAAGLGSNSIDTRGDYATPLAGQYSHEALAVMLANGGELNARDNNGRTALHGAASWGWIPAVEFLAANGVELQVKDNNGLTPLDVALGKTAGAAAGRGGGGNPHPETAALLQKLVLLETLQALLQVKAMPVAMELLLVKVMVLVEVVELVHRELMVRHLMVAQEVLAQQYQPH